MTINISIFKSIKMVMVIGNDDFFKEVRKLCDQTGALMIVDEVQTGSNHVSILDDPGVIKLLLR